MSDPFPHKQGGAKPVEPEPVLPPKPQGEMAAKVEPAPSVSYHAWHAARDLVVMGGLAGLAWIASDDFKGFVEAHPDVAQYAVLAQLAARAVLVVWGQAATAARKQ